MHGSNWNFECWFLSRDAHGERRRTRRKVLGAGTRNKNKLNAHMAPGPGIEPAPQWWEANALTTASSLLFCHAIYIMSSNEREIVRNDKYTRFNHVKMH